MPKPRMKPLRWPSNASALGLYEKKGFAQIANRPAYYQAAEGREDAAVLSLRITGSG